MPIKRIVAEIDKFTNKEKRLTNYDPSLYKTFKKEFPQHKLNPRQIIFAEEWIFDYNGCRACRCAGYTGDSIGVMASKLLKTPKINDYIQWLRADIARTSGLSREKFLAEYAKIGFASIGDLYEDWMSLKDFQSLTPAQVAGIASIKSVHKKFTNDDGTEEVISGYEIKMHDKLKGLEKAERLLGYTTPIQIQVDDVSKKIGSMTDDELEQKLKRLGNERTLKLKSG